MLVDKVLRSLEDVGEVANALVELDSLLVVIDTIALLVSLNF